MDIMKFIYTDSNYTELGVLKNTSIDFEVGKFKTATNDYSLEISINAWDKALKVLYFTHRKVNSVELLTVKRSIHQKM